MKGRFQPGDHLQVWRPGLYKHHGIYINDGRVIQFGGGIALWDKAQAKINAVSLREFEKGGTATVVPHGHVMPVTGYLWEAAAPWKIVERAEFLLKLQPRLPYNLIGHNCETIANLCVVEGYYAESHQVRAFFGARAYASAGILLWFACRSRAKLPLPKWALPAAIVWVLSSVGTIKLYNHQIKLLWAEIGGDWFAHERILDEDPRNGLTE